MMARSPDPLPDPAEITREELLDILRARPTVGVEFAGACCGVSRAAAYRAATSGDLKVLRLGARLMVPSSWLERFLELEPLKVEPEAHGEHAGTRGNRPR